MRIVMTKQEVEDILKTDTRLMTKYVGPLKTGVPIRIYWNYDHSVVIVVGDQ